ncbi:MAG: DAK2 domain-containing protein [Chloroflexota bacterium]
MTQNAISLANIFQTITQTLVENQQPLNQADEINQDHGDNMVQTFQSISRTLLENKDKTDSAALSLAARQLLQSSQSDSGKLYAQGLAQAAAQFSGKEVDSQSALKLLETLIAGGQTAPAPAVAEQPAAEEDLFGTLLGGLMNGAQGQTQQTSPAGEDALGSLMNGLMGGGKTASATDSGLDMTDLLNAGLAFMQEKQSGGSNINALVKAVLSASGMGSTPHRTQSTMLVINSFLKALGTSGQ